MFLWKFLEVGAAHFHDTFPSSDAVESPLLFHPFKAITIQAMVLD